VESESGSRVRFDRVNAATRPSPAGLVAEVVEAGRLGRHTSRLRGTSGSPWSRESLSFFWQFESTAGAIRPSPFYARWGAAGWARKQSRPAAEGSYRLRPAGAVRVTVRCVTDRWPGLMGGTAALMAALGWWGYDASHVRQRAPGSYDAADALPYLVLAVAAF